MHAGRIHKALAEDDDEKAENEERRREHEGLRRAEFEPDIVRERYADKHENQGEERRECHCRDKLVLLPEIARNFISVCHNPYIFDSKYSNFPAKIMCRATKFTPYPTISPKGRPKPAGFATFISQLAEFGINLHPYNYKYATIEPTGL